MGESIVIAAKLGIAAFPMIVADWGLFIAFCAFFLAMPLGHFTIGVLLAMMALFLPRMPDEAKKHQIKVGAGGSHLELGGNVRTVLFGLSALIIAGSFVEGVVR